MRKIAMLDAEPHSNLDSADVRQPGSPSVVRGGRPTLGAAVRSVMQSASGFFVSVRRELGTRDVVLAAASLFLGWLIAHGYYLRALADMQADAAERQRVNELVLRGIESVGTIKFARDVSGKVTGVSVQLTGDARSTSRSGGELTSGATRAALPATSNPSIERTVAGKPAPAAHVERYSAQTTVFTLRCTQKLLRRGLAETAASSQVDTLLGDWYANVLIARPSHLVLCVSERTLLPVVVVAKDIKHLPERVVEAVARVLYALRVEPSAIEAELAAMRTWHVGRTASKRVIGSLNDLMFQLANQLHAHPERSLLEQALHLAEVPMKGVEYSSADRATTALFASAATLERVGRGAL